MLFAPLALALTGVWSVRGQGTSVSKIPPPPNRGVGSYPAFYIYKDVDEIARPGGKLDACSNVKAIRSTCYNLGIKENSYEAEQECLCSQRAALAITQCFSEQYTAITNETVKSQLRQSFLYYTYDCYCGVKEVDPTYNTTAEPVEPFFPGFTGDPILPPVDGCPEKGAPPNVCPVPPPCSACSVPEPPVQAPCPAGNNRCSGICIPSCPPPVCKWPKISYGSECVCPCGWEPEGDDSCVPPTCDGANEEYVVGPGCTGRCVCENGYEYSDELGSCQETCPVGQSRPVPGAPCEVDCDDPLIKDWAGNCVCPYSLGYYVNADGECEVFGDDDCEAPLQPSPYYPECQCPERYYYSDAGICTVPECYDLWNPECYPERTFSNATIAIASSTPEFEPFSEILSAAGSPSSIASVDEQQSTAEGESAASETTIADEPAQPPSAIDDAGATQTSTAEDVPTAGDNPAPPPQETPPPSPEEAEPTIAEAATEPQPAPEEPSYRRLRWARNM